MPHSNRSTTEAAWTNGEYEVGAVLEPTDDDTANGETLSCAIVSHDYLTSGVDACTDSEAFSMTSDCQISLTRDLAGCNGYFYQMTTQATDDSPSALTSDPATVTIKVFDSNFKPVIYDFSVGLTLTPA